MSNAFDDEFGAPAAPGAGINWDDVEGRLLLVQAFATEKAIATVHGESDAIRANVVVLDGPNAGEEYADTLIFPKVLQSQLRSSISTGKRSLGRLGKGEKKPGKNAPWQLGDPTEADKAIARAYLTQNAAPAF